MAERRSYRSAPLPAREVERFPAEGPEEPNGIVEYEREESTAPQRPARKPWNKGGGKTQQDGEYINLTGLFTTKSGKADTVVLTPDILRKLDEMNEGDVLGVSQNKKNGRLQLWYIKKAQ